MGRDLSGNPPAARLAVGCSLAPGASRAIFGSRIAFVKSAMPATPGVGCASKTAQLVFRDRRGALGRIAAGLEQVWPSRHCCAFMGTGHLMRMAEPFWLHSGAEINEHYTPLCPMSQLLSPGREQRPAGRQQDELLAGCPLLHGCVRAAHIPAERILIAVCIPLTQRAMRCCCVSLWQFSSSCNSLSRGVFSMTMSEGASPDLGAAHLIKNLSYHSLLSIPAWLSG